VHVVFLGPFDSRRVQERDDHDDGRRRRQTFQVNAAMSDWRRRSRYRALLVARDTRNRGEPCVIGVASVTTRARYESERTALLDVGPWLLFRDPLRLASLRLRLRLRSHLDRVVEAEESRALPDATGVEVTDRLRALVPEFAALWEQLPEPGSPTRRLVPSTELPLLDAGQTALRLFTRKWGEIEPTREDVPPTQAAARIERLARASENDFITDDATRFLDWELQGPSYGGWFEFQEGERQLLVKNINVSTAESKTGADLVYVSVTPPAVVLVQYKLLERLKSTDELIYRPDGRLSQQVSKMLRLGRNSEPARDSSDLRLGEAVGFVKFVDPAEQRALSARSIHLSGHYHPADLVAQMLGAPGRGPEGGVVHRVSEWRSIDGEVFARLIRDRWVGSRGDVTEELLKILGLSPDRDPMVLAVEERSGRKLTQAGAETW
jgi:hypothetical protein